MCTYRSHDLHGSKYWYPNFHALCGKSRVLSSTTWNALNNTLIADPGWSEGVTAATVSMHPPQTVYGFIGIVRERVTNTSGIPFVVIFHPIELAVKNTVFFAGAINVFDTHIHSISSRLLTGHLKSIIIAERFADDASSRMRQVFENRIPPSIDKNFVTTVGNSIGSPIAVHNTNKLGFLHVPLWLWLWFWLWLWLWLDERNGITIWKKLSI